MKRISSYQNTQKIIEKYGFTLKKKYGQNFLTDERILEAIIEGAELVEEDIVIEIGPGIGSLTQYLAENAKKVYAIEVDKGLIPILEETLEDYDNIEIYNQDILKMDFNDLIGKEPKGTRFKIVANLPYYITTPIIMKIFEEHLPISSITVMIQEEVASRMQAKPSTKEYGALSLVVQYYSLPKIIEQVPPTCFIPQPKVGSTVICLQARDTYKEKVDNEKFLFQLIHGAFQQRRKTLVNTLSHQPYLSLEKDQIRKVLEEMDLSLTIRGEALSLDQFIELAQKLEV